MVSNQLKLGLGMVAIFTGIIAIVLVTGGENLVLGNVSNLQLTTNFRDFNCDAWNELAVTKGGVTTVVGSGRTGFNPLFESGFQTGSLLTLTDAGGAEVEALHVRLLLQCDGNFIKHPTTVTGSMSFQLCGDPIGGRTICFAGSDRTFTQLIGSEGLTAVSVQTFFDVPIQSQSIPDDLPKVIFEGDISAFEIERLFTAGGTIHFKSVMFPRLTWTFNHPTLGIFSASYDAIRLNDPIIAQYGQLRITDIDPDTDGDGIVDSLDGCINQPETFNGFQDADGCPDVAPTVTDTDGDGIPDDVDQCVTMVGTIENNGCPMLIGEPPTVPTDSDGDGVTDEIDQCRLEVGTVANLGCPEPVIMEEMEMLMEEAPPEGVGEFFPPAIPPPIFEPLPPPIPTPDVPITTTTPIPFAMEEEQRTLVILGLLFAGIIAIIIAGIVNRMRKK